jgi:queuine/archaeosine tRNA-ribosyltransferase
MKGNIMATIGGFDHFSEVLQMRMLEKQDVIFEKGSICICGEKKYKVLVNGIEKNEVCPACEGEMKVTDLIGE